MNSANDRRYRGLEEFVQELCQNFSPAFWAVFGAACEAMVRLHVQLVAYRRRNDDAYVGLLKHGDVIRTVTQSNHCGSVGTIVSAQGG